MVTIWLRPEPLIRPPLHLSRESGVFRRHCIYLFFLIPLLTCRLFREKISLCILTKNQCPPNNFIALLFTFRMQTAYTSSREAKGLSEHRWQCSCYQSKSPTWKTDTATSLNTQNTHVACSDAGTAIHPEWLRVPGLRYARHKPHPAFDHFQDAVLCMHMEKTGH